MSIEFSAIFLYSVVKPFLALHQTMSECGYRIKALKERRPKRRLSLVSFYAAREDRFVSNGRLNKEKVCVPLNRRN